jgi:hypothetical protein
MLRANTSARRSSGSSSSRMPRRRAFRGSRPTTSAEPARSCAAPVAANWSRFNAVGPRFGPNNGTVSRHQAGSGPRSQRFDQVESGGFADSRLSDSPYPREHRVMTLRPALGHLSFCCVIVLLASCAKPPKPPVEDLSGRENLSSFTLGQVRGTRNGDRLDAEAEFADGSSTLTVEMGFTIGAPTKLKSGRWRRPRDGRLTSGTVAERSVIFLGGQDGPPSIGGRFDLLDPTGVAEYRITIPTTELRVKLLLGKPSAY